MRKDIACCDDVKNDCRERECLECEIPALERNNYFCGKLMVERDFWCDQHYHMGKQRRHNSLAHGWGTLCGLKVVEHPKEECQDKYVLLKPGVALDCCGREIQVRQEEYIKLPLKENKEEVLERRTNESIERLKKRTSSTVKVADINKIKTGFRKDLEAIKVGPVNLDAVAKKMSASAKKIVPDMYSGRFESDIREWLSKELTLCIAIRYRECFTEEVPSLFDECGCDDKCEPNRIRETYEVRLFSGNTLRKQLKKYDEGGTPLKEGPCDEIYKTVIEECPKCDECGGEKWVVLATIENYTSGDRVILPVEGEALKVGEALIDNFTYRRLVPSTDKIYEIVRCLLEKGGGGGQGPPGPKGEKGEKGDTGSNGPAGKDGLGLNPDLPKILDISWGHGKEIDFLKFVESLRYDNKPEEVVKKHEKAKKYPPFTIYFNNKLNGIDRQTLLVQIDYAYGELLPVFGGLISPLPIRLYGYPVEYKPLLKTPNTKEDAAWAVTFVPDKLFLDVNNICFRFLMIAMANILNGENVDLPSVHLRLKGDFIWAGDKFDENHILDADNIGGQVGINRTRGGIIKGGKNPSGDLVQGGDFESWFFLKAPDKLKDLSMGPIDVKTSPNFMVFESHSQANVVNFNKASLAEIKGAGFTEKDAKNIIKYRKKTPFLSIGDIEKVPGITSAEIDDKLERIAVIDILKKA